MTDSTEERIKRLESAVERVAAETANFVRGQTEVNATLSRAVSTLAQAVSTLAEDVRIHSAAIRRLGEQGQQQQ